MADEYVKVEMSKREWQDVLIDLHAFAGAMGNRDLEGYGEELDPGSKALIELLGWQGVGL